MKAQINLFLSNEDKLKIIAEGKSNDIYTMLVALGELGDKEKSAFYFVAAYFLKQDNLIELSESLFEEFRLITNKISLAQ